MNKINLNHPEFYKEAFSIIDSKLKAGLHSELMDTNHLANSFRDYVNIGLRLKKYSWVNYFIDKYEKFLPVNTRNDDRNINKGRLYIHKGEYLKALEYLNSVRKSNFLYYTDSGFLKIRVYYYIKKYEKAYEEIGRIKSYVSYHKEIGEFYKNKFINHIKDSETILKYKTGSINLQNLVYYFSKRKTPAVPNWISEIIMRENLLRKYK